jgi:uncharacterized membrane protein YbaN (DUF454 family)
MQKSHSMTATVKNNRLARGGLILFGWFNVGVAFVGVILPGLPTTPFLLIAVWAFARSSDRFHDWLYNHPRFGPSLKAWRDHRAVSVRAKVLAVLTMALSLLYAIFFVAEDWVMPTLMACLMLPTAAWLITRTSRVESVDDPLTADVER